MKRVGKIIFLLIICNLWFVAGWSQACTTLGQNPTTAFPVCGTNFFTQTTVPACGGTRVPTKCTDNAQYSDVNPYWYKFTCFKTGTLGFVITPKNLGDDYDWQLFDITGRNPMDIYSDATLIVSANWSGSSGATGASQAGLHAFECASNPSQNISTFSIMPTITAGHDYLLLVSHFDDALHTQSGYDLSFPVGTQGGTASIVNPLVPAILNARAVCDGTQIVVTINKRINCNTIAIDGSDFSVSGPIPVSIKSESGSGCNNGFDADTIVLNLNTVLSPGMYTVTAKMGSDGNTLTDNCNNNLAVGANTSLTFIPAQPTPMDSIQPVICMTDTLRLVFSKPMNCNSIAPDGSDFTITGPAPVTLKSAKGICNNGISNIIQLLLTAPIRVNGTFTISLKNGNDGNTLLNECSMATPAGATLSFTTKNITTADFQSVVNPGCKSDTLLLTHNGYGGTTQWQWSIDSNVVSNFQNVIFISKSFGTHSLQLNVSNGICADSAKSTFLFTDFTVKAAFSSADTLCPSDTSHFTDLSSSSASSWRWDFGNGVTSTLQSPGPQSYPLSNYRTNYLTSLRVSNHIGCSDTTYKYITVLTSCYIAVPSAFTPNGDGLNDYLYPLNAFKADNLVFRVYNRYGQVIFESKNWTKKWDGSINGVPQPSGTYVWTLNYTDVDTRQPVFKKGTAVLIR